MKGGALVVALAVLASGCGDSSNTGGGAIAKVAGTSAADWARDACQTLPAAEAGAAAGVEVIEAKPSLQNDAGGMILSTCSYDVKGRIHDSFTVSLRGDKDGDARTERSIAELSEGDGMLGPVETVAVPTGQARWLPKMKQLVYYPDDARIIYVVGPGVNPLGIGPKSDPDATVQPRALKVALAAAD